MNEIGLTRSRGASRAKAWLAVAAIAASLGATSAWAQAPAPGAAPPPPPPHGMHHRGPPGHGPGGPEMMMFGGSPEQINRHVDHMLDGLSATDAQRSQIKQIAVAAAADLKALRQSERTLHDRSLQIFTAATVDANAAESLRAQIQAARDQASRRVLQAMLDVSRVLTPEQRAQIGERVKQQQARMQDRMQRMEKRGQREGAKP